MWKPLDTGIRTKETNTTMAGTTRTREILHRHRLTTVRQYQPQPQISSDCGTARQEGPFQTTTLSHIKTTGSTADQTSIPSLTPRQRISLSSTLSASLSLDHPLSIHPDGSALETIDEEPSSVRLLRMSLGRLDSKPSDLKTTKSLNTTQTSG